MDSSDPTTIYSFTSISQPSSQSQTAQDYIASQLSLEADAREALPYQFDTCTKLLGPLRQSVYACLTCTPPPASPHQQFTPAGVCYSCSISCHGEHNLVELFTKRDFVCDCGTTRLANGGTPCTLRSNEATGRRVGVTGEEAREGNKYNQNFQGKFCGCGEEYVPEMEKGTMFQCLGLGHVEDGGCGEDWWHPECLLGLPRAKHEHKTNGHANGGLEIVHEGTNEAVAEPTTNGTTPNEHQHIDDPPLPAGFPDEDDFDHMICYKCVNAFPWIKAYANSPGFLTAGIAPQPNGHTSEGASESDAVSSETRKRKAEDEPEDSQESKKVKADEEATTGSSGSASAAEAPQGSEAPQTSLDTKPKHANLPPAPTGDYITLFLKEDFRDDLCRCPECFPHLAPHAQLLEEEEAYEPPLSDSDGANSEAGGPGSVAGRSVNSGSLLDRGEAALSSMDRVKAIEGVMAYNHVKDKVKAFLQPFAESGQPVGAEEIRAYFAKLRGDEMAEREAMIKAEQGGSSGGGYRRGQEGY